MATAIAAPDRADLTYDGLAEQIASTGRAVHAAGFERADRVALVVPNGAEAATAFLSIASACVCAPLNPAYREAEFDFYLRDLRPKAIAVAEEGPVTDAACRLGIPVIQLARTSGDAAGVFRLEGLRAKVPGECEPPGPGDTALLLHTSGTTSRPKLVPLTWGNLGHSAGNISRTLGLSPADRCLNVMPLFHIHGLAAVLLASLSSGASVVCTPGFLATSFFDWLDAFAPTWYSAVPTMHQAVLGRAGLHAEALARHRLRFIRSSSAALPVRVLEELEARFGVPVIEAYGMTEAAHQMASNPLPPGMRKPGSAGRATGTEIAVRDEACQPLPAGATGHIWIAGPNVTPGYLDNPEANGESFADGWFRTGDLGWLDEDGYLFLSGRSKEIVNRGGEKISPREVDEVLMRHASVGQCLTFALPDSRLGEEVGAAVVLRPGEVPDEAAIQSFAAQLLAEFKVPRRIYFLDEIPAGPTGKPQRIGLAARLGIGEDAWKRVSLKDGDVSHTKVDSTVAARVRAIMAEVLCAGSVDPDANFFDAGGDSLLGTRLLARLGSEFHCAFTLVDLFQAPTPDALAGLLSTRAAADTEMGPERDSAALAVLSFGQIRLWFLDAYEGGSLAYQRPHLIEISGNIEYERVRAALVRIVERHEPLRTSIQNEEGNPVPRIRAAEPLPLEMRDWRGVPGAEAAAREACVVEASRPFRLDSELPLRAALHRLGEGRWWLLVVIHHIAFDGWSAGILLRELGALLRGEGLAPLPVAYSDYARWQEHTLSEGRLEVLLNYWRTQLDGVPLLHDLPLDFPRPALQTFHGKVVSATLPPDLAAKLHGLSRECGVTLFMTLLAGWKALLARLCGMTDICVGVPVAGRSRVEWEPLIGLFINTLALRSELGGDPAFRDILARVRETCLQAWSHQDMPFEKLLQALNPERSPAHTPWFQVLFQLRNFPKSPPDAREESGLSVRRVDFDLDTVPNDLHLEIDESEQGLACRLFYNTALFTEGSAAGTLQRFEVLLRGAAEARGTRLSALPILTVGERGQLLVEWNATQVFYPRDLCIHQLFEQQAERTPDSIAVVCGDRRLTYRELNQRSNQLAHSLRHLGVKPDDLVGICTARSPEMVVGLLGILKAGGAYVPLDPAYPAERLRFMAEDAQARVVLTQERLRGLFAGQGNRVVCLDTEWDEIAKFDRANPIKCTEPEHAAYVIYTSGSTGRPKGVVVPHHGPANLIHWAHGVFDPGEMAGVLFSSSISFDLSVFEMFAPLSRGGKCVLVGDALQLREAPPRAEVTLINTVPSVMKELLRLGAVPPTVRTVVLAGELTSVDLVREIYRLPGVRRVWDLYGPTETTVYSTFALRQAGDPCTIGRPIANTQIYILDASLEPVPAGVTGELYIGGDGLARGYLNRPELTAEKFIAHPFSGEPGARIYSTGDLARYRPDGNIEFLGRIDGQVKVRGFRIELGEIEAVLQQHASVSQCVADAREDAAGEKRLVAWVVPVDPRRAPAIAELRDWLMQTLPEYMVPGAFAMLPSLPRTPNGKIDRKALPEPDGDAHADRNYEAPEGKTETALAALWGKVLNLERIGRQDNFFELGGHSLLAMRLISRIRNVFQTELPLRCVLECKTLAALAEHIGESLDDASGRAALSVAPPILPVSRAQDLPLSFAQERLWFLDQLRPHCAAYNIPLALHIEGAVEAGVLQRCLTELLRRHEALRTRFDMVHGRPVQVIEAPDAIAMPVTDLSQMPEAEREAEAGRLCEEEARRPFDLTQAPMLRARLLRMDATRHVLMLNVHHVAADGWSFEILLKELGILYQAFLRGHPSPLPELPIQYADFAAWQRRDTGGEAIGKRLSYWREQLRDAPALLELPTDRPRPPVSSYRGAIEEIVLPDSLLEALRVLSRQEEATLFMTVLAAFQNLLSRYTGQQDVSVGVPAAGRSRTETEGLIGFFVNMLVLRCDLSGNLTFRALLRRVRELVLDAHAHQDLPFERLVRELRRERSMSHGPLFQVAFGMENTPDMPAGPGRLDLRAEWVHSGTAKFDLYVRVGKEPGGWKATAEYATDLFERETILRLLANFRSLLEAVAARPDEPIRNPLALPPAEPRPIPLDRNATEIAGREARCIHQFLERQAERTPEAAAVSYEGAALTYRELNERANALAQSLAGYGVAQDIPVGMYMGRSLDLFVAILGVLKAGGACVPVDPAYPDERVRLILEDCGAPLVVTEERLIRKLPESGAQRLCIESTRLARASEAPMVKVSGENLAYVIYTSGSTGRPKGVAMPHAALANLIAWQDAALPLRASGRVLQFSALSFDVWFQEMFSTWCAGGELISILEEKRRDPAALIGLIDELRIERVFLPFVALQTLAAAACRRSVYPSGLRDVVTAGEQLRITPEIRRMFGRIDRSRLHNHYGPSETHVVTSYTMEGLAAEWPSLPPIGRAIPGVAIHVLDSNREPVSPGSAGELYLGGIALARGYWNQPELTRDRFIEDPYSAEPGARLYRTGDLARCGTDGNIQFLGRLDSQVKVRGFRIELEEIEAALQQHAGVSQCAVAAREDAEGEKRLVAWVVPADPRRAPAITELRDFLKRKLPDHMRPGAFVLLPNLPVTPSGKIDRKGLPEPDEDSRAVQSHEAPEGPNEIALAAVWAELLSLERVGRHDDFFELGGHSLLAMRLVSRVRDVFHIEIPLRTVFENTKFTGLAERIDEYLRILVDWNATECSYPRDRCIHQLFEQQTERTPESIALVFGDRQLTYRELNRRSNRVAHHLRTLGVKPHDLVGICVERSLEMVVGLLGILKSGAAYVPLDPAYPAERLDFMRVETGAAIVLTQARLRHLVPRGSGIVCLDADWQRIQEAEDGNPNLDASAEDLAYAMYTSGSTGGPKGVEIPHRGVVRLASGLGCISPGADEVFLQMAPLSFDASTFEIWVALLHGARLVIMPPEQPTLEEIGRAIRDHKITTLWLTTGLFHLMAEERAADLKPLRQLLTGGDVLSARIVREALPELGDCRLINCYGPTESTTFASCYPVEPEIGGDRPIPIGRPIGNTQIYILDAGLQPLPVGVAGELCIGGDGLARGYLNRPELTAEKFIAHPFSAEPGARIYRTGDRARYRPDGNIEFHGRIDNQVKVRGFRIEFGEIEAALQEHTGVSQCVAAVREDAAGEKRLVAWVVPVDPRRAPAIAELRDFLKQKLPDFMVPAAFVMLPELPLTLNGKIDRGKLPAPDRARATPGPGRHLVEPRTMVELQLKEIWERILDVPAVGIRDNFFALGGHSLLAVRLMGEIHKSIHRSLPLAVCFQNPTIEGMAKALGEEHRAEDTPELILLRLGGSQGELFFLDAGMGLCRLAGHLEGGLAKFATYVPLTRAAIRAAAGGKNSELPSVEELAAAHAALIQSRQPVGPCILAGHSFGGLLAFEVAHQLKKAGRKVEMILLLDSWARTPPWWKKLKLLTPDRLRNSLLFRARYQGSRIGAKARNEAKRLVRAVSARPSPEPDAEDVNKPFGEAPWHIREKVYRHAWGKYSFRQLDSRAVMFRSRDSALAHLHAIDGKMGWDGLFAGGLEIIETPGDHMSLLTTPHVESLALQLQERLEEFGRRPEIIQTNEPPTSVAVERLL